MAVISLMHIERNFLSGAVACNSGVCLVTGWNEVLI